MPTGYTAGIEDGKITSGKEFLMLCARAFGICMDMRDEPLSVPVPQEFFPSHYHEREIEKTREDISKLLAMTPDEITAKINDEYEARKKGCAKLEENRISIIYRYAEVLQEVIKWNPPTPEHQGLKDFAIKQINMCIGDFNPPTEYERTTDNPPENPEQWLADRLESEYKSLAYHEKQWEEELARTASRNEWLRQLRESLAKI